MAMMVPLNIMLKHYINASDSVHGVYFLSFSNLNSKLSAPDFSFIMEEY